MRAFDYDKTLLNFYPSDLKIPKCEMSSNLFLDLVEKKLDIKIGNLVGLGLVCRLCQNEY